MQLETLDQRLKRLRAEQSYQAPTLETGWAPQRRSPIAEADMTTVAPEEPVSVAARAAQVPSGNGRLVVVGDSLGVGTTPYLKAAGSDTKVGRSSASAVDALKRLGGGAGRVLFDAGTNDASASQLAQSLRRARKVAGGATLYVPTVNGPDAAAKNAVIRQMADRGLIQMIDWASRSKGLVGSDGIHASGVGYRKRAQLIRDALG